MSFQHCQKRFYLSKKTPERATPLGESTAIRMRIGGEIGELAWADHPNGVSAEKKGADSYEKAEITQKLIDDGCEVIFEATFIYEDLITRCDILRKKENGWELVEVKSSSKVKDEHIPDVAFQKYVLSKLGIPIVRCFVKLLSKTWKKGSDAPMFAEVDIDSRVEEELRHFEQKIDEMRCVLDAESHPEILVNKHCNRNNKCNFYEHCFADIPDDDVVFLPRIQQKKVDQYRTNEYLRIGDIPAAVSLSGGQNLARIAQVTGEYIDKMMLKKELSRVIFPALFIDFETTRPSLPPFENHSPLTEYAFQWSAHLLESEEDKGTHFGYLSREFGDQRNEFIESMIPLLKKSRTVIHYSSHEKNVMKGMMKDEILQAKEASQCFEMKSVDLQKILEKSLYYTAFRGSYSIKTVLPILVPDLSYQEMEIADGDTASVLYAEGMFDRLDKRSKEKLLENLWEYCQLDSLAMVEIYRKLLKMVEE